MCDLKNGGCNIVPCARKSIHWYRECPYTNGRNMGRYGNSSDDEQSDAGVDEVDNVMSKFSYETSTPLVMPVRRRNSLIPVFDVQLSDDSEEHGALAKSLPARLPSRLNYSDDFDSRHIGSNLSNRLNKSDPATPRSRGHRNGDSRNSSFATRSSNISHRINQSSHANTEQQIRSSGKTFFIYLLVLLPALLAAYYYDFFRLLVESRQVYDEAKFHDDLTELGAKYKVGDDSILQLQAGISAIFKREDTSCVVILYNSKNSDFHPSKFEAFVDNVASNAAKFLRNDTTPGQHIVVEGSDLTMRSPTQLMKAYREDVARTGVLLVRHVEHVPSPLAMAFHYYCDEYNPLVKKSAIFFTMNTAMCPDTGKKSAHASVEMCLKEKWTSVPKDNIGPLLTRVVSVVVDVTSGI